MSIKFVLSTWKGTIVYCSWISVTFARQHTIMMRSLSQLGTWRGPNNHIPRTYMCKSCWVKAYRVNVIRWWSLEEEIKWKKYDICHVDFFLNFLDAFLLHESLNQMSYLFKAHQTGCWRRRWRIWQSPIRTPPDLDSWGSRANKPVHEKQNQDRRSKEGKGPLLQRYFDLLPGDL